MALGELDRLFDPDEFGGSPFAESWHDRAERGLTKLYENWPAPGRAAHLAERKLQTIIDDVRWTGRADRIDGDSAGLTVVDYKTSTQALPVEEAAVSLQLGYYVLAAARDESIGRAGIITGAEFWYPMTSAKSVTTRSFDMARLPDVEARLKVVADGIRSEDWTPRPGTHCERCSLRTLCPAWSEGGPDFS